MIVWQPIRSKDDRAVIYWLGTMDGRSVGAVRKHDEGWVATGYPLDGRPIGPRNNARLGAFPTRPKAQAAVRSHAS